MQSGVQAESNVSNAIILISRFESRGATMKKTDIPQDVLDHIRRNATESWGDNADMVKYAIDTEVDKYIDFHTLEFGSAEVVRKKLIESARSDSFSWEESFDVLEREVAAYNELQALSIEGVPNAFLLQACKVAADNHPESYSDQLEYIQNASRKFVYVKELEARIGPKKELLIRMERIIGGECYNGNIQNYGPWGVWEGEGRSYRYPVTFRRDGENEKRWSVPSDTEEEILITGRYRFGANELNIFRALEKIVDMLESDYGFESRRKQKKHSAEV